MCGKVLREEDHYNIIVAVAQKKMVTDRKELQSGAPFLSRPVLRSKECAGALLPTQIFLSTAVIPLLLPMPALGLLRVE